MVQQPVMQPPTCPADATTPTQHSPHDPQSVPNSPNATLTASAGSQSAPQPPNASIVTPAKQQLRFSKLESSHSRIRNACAEYAFFGPQRFRDFAEEVGELEDHATVRLELPNHPPYFFPDPEQMKVDLQTLFTRFLALDSDRADEVYAAIALRARGAANDELSGLGWESFQEIVAEGVRSLESEGMVVKVRDLETLPRLKELVGGKDDYGGDVRWVVVAEGRGRKHAAQDGSLPFLGKLSVPGKVMGGKFISGGSVETSDMVGIQG